jgi:thiosulfate/3-mercaptopyruvate sulfurtransferase
MKPTLPTPLVDAATLRALLEAANPPLLLDTSFDLADQALGRRQYLEAHLPGARYAHLDDQLSAPKTGPDGRFRGRHPLPSRETFAATAGTLGITPATPVVVYDRHGASYAVRAWWMLRWLGHDAVAVLDGGLDAWRAAGGALESGVAAWRETPPYPLDTPRVAAIDADALARRLGSIKLIDARAAERFRGEVEPLDAKAGHIPGARNRFFKLNLGADGRFKDAATLRGEFAELLGDAAPADVVHHCGSGVTACHNLLAMELAGLAGSRLYPGSWSEWSSDPSRPVAVG